LEYFGVEISTFSPGFLPRFSPLRCTSDPASARAVVFGEKGVLAGLGTRRFGIFPWNISGIFF
jgi:hypothetical protein